MLRALIIGHLGQDCNVNTVNNQSVINFSVAHTEKYKDKDGVSQSKTTWVNCSWWTDRLTIAQYLTRGTQIYVEGVPDVKVFTKRNGSTDAMMICRVSNVTLLGSGKKEEDHQEYHTNTTDSTPVKENSIQEDTDDIPF